MKKRKVWKILAIVFIIITVARESGYLTLNYHLTKSSNKSSIMADISSTAATWDESEEEKTKLPPVRVILIYGGEEYGDVTTGESDDTNRPVKIDISDIDLGSFLWTPLYKYTSINYNKRFSRQVIINKNGVDKNSTRSAEIDIECTLSFIGFCSYRTAKEIVLYKVMNEIYSMVKSQM